MINAHKKDGMLPTQRPQVDFSPTKIQGINTTFQELDHVRKYYSLRASVELRYNLLLSIRIMLNEYWDDNEKQSFTKKFDELLGQKIRYVSGRKSQFISMSDKLDMELREWIHSNKNKLAT